MLDLFVCASQEKLPSLVISVFWGCSVCNVSEVLNELRRRGCRVLAGFAQALRLGLSEGPYTEQAVLSNMVSDRSRRFA